MDELERINEQKRKFKAITTRLLNDPDKGFGSGKGSGNAKDIANKMLDLFDKAGSDEERTRLTKIYTDLVNDMFLPAAGNKAARVKSTQVAKKHVSEEFAHALQKFKKPKSKSTTVEKIKSGNVKEELKEKILDSGLEKSEQKELLEQTEKLTGITERDLTDLKKEKVRLQKEVNRLDDKIAEEPDVSRKQVLTNARNVNRRLLERIRKEIFSESGKAGKAKTFLDLRSVQQQREELMKKVDKLEKKIKIEPSKTKERVLRNAMDVNERLLNNVNNKLRSAGVVLDTKKRDTAVKSDKLKKLVQSKQRLEKQKEVLAKQKQDDDKSTDELLTKAEDNSDRMKTIIQQMVKEPDVFSDDDVESAKGLQAKLVTSAFAIDNNVIPEDSKGNSYWTKMKQWSTQLGPQYNFCGAGTNILENMKTDKDPSNILDLECLKHDLDYLRAGSLDTQKKQSASVRIADRKFIKNVAEIFTGKRDDYMDKFNENKRSIKQDANNILVKMGWKSELDSAKDVANFLTTPLRIAGPLAGEPDVLFVDKVEPLDDKTRSEFRKTLDESLEESSQFIKVFEGEEDFDDLTEELEGLEVGEEEDIPDLPRGSRPSAVQEEDEEKQEEEEVDTEPPEGRKQESDVGGPEVSTTTDINIDNIIGSIPSNAPEVTVDDKTFEKRQMKGLPKTSIIGERSMRPLAFQETGQSVELTDKEKHDNKLWLENFTWIDEGHGNGNQERLPWNFGGGKANNSLFSAQQKNELLRYMGDLYDGGQEYRRPKEVSKATKALFSVPMIPTTQNRQRFIRNGALPAGVGRPIMMSRDTGTLLTPMQRRNNIGQRLFNPDVVDFRRV